MPYIDLPWLLSDIIGYGSLLIAAIAVVAWTLFSEK